MVKRDFALYGAAAAATAMAGVLHLMLGPNNFGFSVNTGILFIVGGIAQVFWIIPMIRKWGTPWYAIGIAGTIAFIAIWAITRMPGNPITGRGSGVNSTAIMVEVFEAAFIGLAAAIIIYENRMKKRSSAQAGTPTRKSSKMIPILAGVVIALVLAGLFVLPMTMARPMGGPPGQRPSGQPGVPQAQQPSAQPTAANQMCTLTLIEVDDTPQQTEGLLQPTAPCREMLGST